MKIKDPWIAKEKFQNISNIKTSLDHHRWVEFIENNKDYFVWEKDTDGGKYILAHIEEVPESFRERRRYALLNKMKALAEFNKKKGYHEIVFSFNEDLHVIGTTFMKRIKKEHLERLLKLADHMEAMILDNGTKIIDATYLNTLE